MITLETVSVLPGPGPGTLAGRAAADPDWCRQVAGLPAWTEDALLTHLPEVAGVPAAMAELERQNPDPGPAETAALDRLRSGQAVCVLTGQQAGLFTGPLYTLYKALTAVALVQALTRRGRPAVAVFWVAAEDHDLAEVTAVRLAGGRPGLVDIRLNREGFPPLPVGHVPLGLEIETARAAARAALEGTGHRDLVTGWLSECCPPAATFGEAFAGLMRRLFAGTGLLLFDPLRAADRDLLFGPPLAPLAADRARVWARLRQATERVAQAGFRPQVQLREDRFGLFRLDPETGRRRVSVTPAGAWVDGGECRWGPGELETELRRRPGRFSPDALLRPLIQDALFPTAVAVLGPAELAYHAQLNDLYPLWGRPAPIRWPRWGATLVHPGQSRRLDRLRLRPEELLGEVIPAVDLALTRRGARGDLDRFRLQRKRLVEELDRLVADLGGLAEPMRRSAAGMRNRVLWQVERFDQRLARHLRREHARVAGAVAELAGELRPGGRPQERSLGGLVLPAWLGPDWAGAVLGRLNLYERGHTLLRLAEAGAPPPRPVRPGGDEG